MYMVGIWTQVLILMFAQQKLLLIKLSPQLQVLYFQYF